MTAPPDSRRVKACLFDAYGTLFDVASPARRLQSEIGPRWGELAALWRQRQLEYSWLRSLMERYADFRVVTAEALDFALASLDMTPEPALRQRLMDLYMTPDAYPEVAETLSTLRDCGMATAILSNGSPDMLAAAIQSAGLSDLLDDCISVDAAGVFKPAPAAYALAGARFGVSPDRLLLASSNGWDIAGAAAFGFHTVWVNRAKAPPERLPGTAGVELESLSGLPAVIDHLPYR